MFSPAVNWASAPGDSPPCLSRLPYQLGGFRVVIRETSLTWSQAPPVCSAPAHAQTRVLRPSSSTKRLADLSLCRPAGRPPSRQLPRRAREEAARNTASRPALIHAAAETSRRGPTVAGEPGCPQEAPEPGTHGPCRGASSFDPEPNARICLSPSGLDHAIYFLKLETGRIVPWRIT